MEWKSRIVGRINKNRYFYVILIILVITIFYGCGTIQVYTGDRLPKEKVAIIKQNGARPYYIAIKEIDGKSVDSVFKNFEILPGVHTLRINVMGSFPGLYRKEDMDTISFVAEIGHVYRVDRLFFVDTERQVSHLAYLTQLSFESPWLKRC